MVKWSNKFWTTSSIGFWKSEVDRASRSSSPSPRSDSSVALPEIFSCNSLTCWTFKRLSRFVVLLFFPIPTFCFSVLFSKFCFFWFLVWEIRCGFVLIGSFLGCLCGNFLQTQLCFCFFVFNFWFCLCLRCVSFDSVCVCLLLDSMKNFGWRSLKPTWGFGWLWFKVVWWNHSDVRVLVLIAVIGCDSFVLCIMIDWQWNYTVILWFMFWTVILCVWIWI